MKHGPSLAVRLTLYPLILVLFLLITAYVIFISAGYELKYKDGRFSTSKTGIIILATRPGEARITVDGEEYEKKTSAISFFKLKINRMPAGTHKVLVERDGYEPWDGEVEVKAGFVSWLDYLILIPLERKADPYNFPGSIESTITSRDQKRVLVYALDKKQGIYNIWQINTENKAQEKIYEAKIGSKEKIELLSYSNNNARYLYKKIDKNNKTSFITAEATAQGLSSNISTLFGATATNYVYSPYNENELYYVANGNVYKVNSSNKSQSAVLANNVVGIYPNAKNMLMIKKTDDNYGLWELRENGDMHNIIKAIPSSGQYNVSYIESQKLYLVHNLDDKDLYLYGNEVKNPTLETIAKNVTQYTIPVSGERIGFYTGDTYKVYDLKSAKYVDAIRSNDIKMVDWFSDSSNILYATSEGVYLVNLDGQYNKLLFGAKNSSPTLATEVGRNVFFTNVTNGDKDLFSFSL